MFLFKLNFSRSYYETKVYIYYYILYLQFAQITHSFLIYSQKISSKNAYLRIRSIACSGFTTSTQVIGSAISQVAFATSQYHGESFYFSGNIRSSPEALDIQQISALMKEGTKNSLKKIYKE